MQVMGDMGFSKGKKNGRKWEYIMGYTLDDLINRIEKLFTPEMNWNNYGSYWQVDHIIPKVHFKYIHENDLEFKKCWSLSNLQPLEATKNREKRSKILWLS